MATSKPILESDQETLISLLWASFAPSVGHEHRQRLQDFNLHMHAYKKQASQLIDEHKHVHVQITAFVMKIRDETEDA